LQKLLLLLQLIKIILKAFSNLIILHQYSHYFKIDDCLLKDFDKREELLQLTYFLELLIQQFNEIIFITALQLLLYLAIVYLIAIDNFTLTKAVIAIALIKVVLIFFAYALFFLFLIAL